MTKELVYKAAARFAEEVKKEYGEKLKQVILFGSCARGDFDSSSDMDIMILLDVPQSAVTTEMNKIFSVVHRLDLEFDYEILFAPVVQSEALFNEYINAAPFYKNIQKEGVKIA